METSKIARGRGRPQEVLKDAGKDKDGAGLGSDKGRDLAGQAKPEAKPNRKGWEQARERLSGLEKEGTPVCAIYWPDEVGALWSGTYGGATIYKGEPVAVLSDGERIAL